MYKYQITNNSLWFTDYRFTDEFTELTKGYYPQHQLTESVYLKQITQRLRGWENLTSILY
jgi:hypothetical protein